MDEIRSEFGYRNRPLDEEAHSVLIECWRMLEQALADEEITDEKLCELKEQKVIPNRKCLLNPPTWMHFEDRPRLAEKFGDFLQANVIARPAGAAKAMQSAGVRPLSQAVEVEVLEKVDPMDDEDLLDQIISWEPQLRRAAGVSSDEFSIPVDLRVVRVDSLKIRYALNAFNRYQHSQPESVEAHFVAGECALYIRGKSQPKWLSVARELAYAICPGTEARQVAAGIKEVLAAGTPEEADTILDELGYPPREDSPVTPINTGETIDQIGSETLITSEDDSSGVSSPTSTTDNTVPGEGKQTTSEAVESVLGPNAPQPTPPPDNGTHSSSQSQREASGGTGNRTTPRHVGKLRTYVKNNEHDDEDVPDAETRAHRDAIERAGVDCVLRYEQDTGRIPKEMPPMNEGYDIESREKEGGEVIRYIEVKALSGNWRDNPNAALSKSQFKMASENGDRYWLYVVERADQKDCRLHRIQNPARRTNQFIYDDGWQALAEPNNSNSNEGTDYA